MFPRFFCHQGSPSYLCGLKNLQSYIIMANTADISRGMILNLEGNLYSVVEFGENKTARAGAKIWAKLKGVDNNRSIEKNLEQW